MHNITRVKHVLDLLPSVFQPLKSFLQVRLGLWIGGFDGMEGDGVERELEIVKMRKGVENLFKKADY